uniref:CCHC-type domain-containing protein n=1 Tax=Populus alba TaxID=43335 RepID=A0A4U5NJX8_POPAL|nr:hypothetical protein D5086_0000263590 [Populus alba]
MADVPEEKSAGNASIPPQYIRYRIPKFEVEKFDGKDQKYAFSEQNSAKELWQALEDKFMEEEYRESSLLEEKDLPFSAQERRYLAKDECAFCHKKGHWKKDCPIKGNKEKDEPTVNVAREEDERDSAFMVSSPEKTLW